MKDSKIFPKIMLQYANPFLSWKKLSGVVEMEFGPSAFDDPIVALFKLAQISTLDDYYLEFTALANCLTSLEPEALLDYF